MTNLPTLNNGFKNNQKDAAIAELATALVSSQSIETISELVLNHAKLLTGSLFGYVGFIDPQTGYLVVPTLTKDIWNSCQIENKTIFFKEFTGLWGWGLKNKKSFLTNTPNSDKRSSGVPSGHIEIKRFICAPAMIGDTMVGQLGLANASDDYTEKDLALLERLAALYAIAIHRKKNEDRLEKLSQLNESLIKSGNLSEKLNRITEGVVKIFDADFCRIWITSQGDLCDTGCFHVKRTDEHHICRIKDLCLHLMASSGRYNYIDGKVHRRVPFGCYKIGRVASGNDPKFITNDVTHDPRVHNHEWAKSLGLVSFAGYRLLSSEDKPIGVLALFSKHAITPDEDTLLENMANTTAQIIQAVKSEEARSESEQKIRALFDHTFQFIGMLAPDGTILDLNQTTLDFIKKNRVETIGKYFWNINWGTNLPNEQELLKDAIKKAGNGQFIRFETWFTSGNNNIYDIDFSLKPVKDKYGCVSLLIAEGRDITEQKQAVRQMFRTYKLAALGQIIAGVAHEVNNPNNLIYFNLPILKDYLNAIRVLLDRFAAKESDLRIMNMTYEMFFDDLFQLIADMELGSSRISKIVSELKNYTHSHNEETKKPENIKNVIDHVLTLVGKQIQKLVKRFNVHVADDLPLVLVKSSKIEQVLINLIINAGQAADKSNSYVSLVVDRDAQKTDVIAICIEDNGCGIPEDIANKIFDPFFTTKGRDAGTGLGLAISQRIIEEHRGQISFKSKAGQGTLFTVHLPAYKGDTK
ncbi:MAG: GAF domain-containing protein [Desulfobacterales bacterium]|nr:GAF domain-containing protein [Desulfobacterales bacterium]